MQAPSLSVNSADSFLKGWELWLPTEQSKRRNNAAAGGGWTEGGWGRKSWGVTWSTSHRSWSHLVACRWSLPTLHEMVLSQCSRVFHIPRSSRAPILCLTLAKAWTRSSWHTRNGFKSNGRFNTPQFLSAAASFVVNGNLWFMREFR